MRALVSRLARLEREVQTSGRQRLTVQFGYLKTLPDDYTGPRHVVTLRQIPPAELPPASRAEAWFEWEERTGPEPVSTTNCPNDDILIRAYYVEAKMMAGSGAPSSSRNRYRYPGPDEAETPFRREAT